MRKRKQPTERDVLEGRIARGCVIESARAWRDAYDGDDDAVHQEAEERLLKAVDNLTEMEAGTPGRK